MQQGTGGKGSRHFIFSGGWVGINVTDPDTSLDVDGNIKIGTESNVSHNGSCFGE